MGVFLLKTVAAGVLAVTVCAISHPNLRFPYTFQPPPPPKKIIKIEAHMICGMLVLTSLLREITEWICSVLLHLCEGVSSRRRGCWKNKSRGGGGEGEGIYVEDELTNTERGAEKNIGYRKMKKRRRTRPTGNGA